MASIKQMISNLVTRAVVTLISQDESKGKIFAQVLGLAGEIRSDVEHLQQYGSKSIPFKGARGILIAYGGSKDNATLILVDDKRFGQFDLQEGDYCIYSQNKAHTIYRGDDILETLDGKKLITIGSTTFEFSSTGLKVLGGNIETDQEVTAKLGGTAIGLSTHKQDGSATAPDGPISPTGTPIP